MRIRLITRPQTVLFTLTDWLTIRQCMSSLHANSVKLLFHNWILYQCIILQSPLFQHACLLAESYIWRTLGEKIYLGKISTVAKPQFCLSSPKTFSPKHSRYSDFKRYLNMTMAAVNWGLSGCRIPCSSRKEKKIKVINQWTRLEIGLEGKRFNELYLSTFQSETGLSG